MRAAATAGNPGCFDFSSCSTNNLNHVNDASAAQFDLNHVNNASAAQRTSIWNRLNALHI